MNTLIVLLAGLLPTYIIRFPVFGIPTNLFEVAVVGVFFASLCMPSNRKQMVDTFRALPASFKFWTLLFLLSAVISTLYSPVVRSSLGILKGWIVIPMIFGLLVRVAVIASLPARQAGSEQSERRSNLMQKKMIHSLIYSGLVVALLGISQINGFMRITSIYDVPNSLALFLVPVFVIALLVGIQEKNRFYQLSSLVMLIAIIATQSFGAMVALIGVFLIAVMPDLIGHPRALDSRIRGNDKVIFPLFFICLVFAIALFLFSGRFSYLTSPLIHPGTTNSATVRLQLWDIGIRLIKKHPILGVGLGQFEPAYQAELHRMFNQQANEAKAALPVRQAGISYKLQPEFVFRDPHNWIISFWLNVGVLGLVSFIALNFLAIKSIPSPVLGEGGGEGKELYRDAVALALISILIFGLFDTVYWKNDLSALWWMLIFLGAIDD